MIILILPSMMMLQKPLLLIVVVVFDQQAAHEFPGFVIGQPAVLGDNNLNVEIITMFALQLCQAGFDCLYRITFPDSPLT
jgi:hypothetical protein